MEDVSDYDVYVIGGGPAGSSAAWYLADQGINVALIDRGKPIGSKNVSGGVLWGHDLKVLDEEWWKKAPIERAIISKKIGLLTEDKAMLFDWDFEEWGHEPYVGFSILRAKFDRWLAKRAQEAGADIYEGIAVDKLWIEKGEVKGIVQAGDKFKSKAVIVADGANSRILINSGLLTKPFSQNDFYLGIKEVLTLPEETIEERFGLNSEEGTAFEFILGGLPKNIVAGGFLYTNKRSLSLGVVVDLDTLPLGIHSYDVFEYYKQHPKIKRLIKDAKEEEYAAHFVPKGGLHMMPPLFGNGYVVVGDAAALCFSNGLVINGNGPAIRSGIEAAKVVSEAIKIGDTSSKFLSKYATSLKSTYVLENLIRFKNVEKFKDNPRIYSTYTPFILNFSEKLLREENKPREHLVKLLKQELKEAGINSIKAAIDLSGVRYL